MIAALPWRHGVDDGFEARELLFVDLTRGLLQSGEGADRWHHLQNRLHRSELLNLLELFAEVFEGKSVAKEGFLGQLFGLFAGERGIGLLDEREYVAHAKDAADDAVGVKGLEGVGLFAHADELDGLAGH